MKKKIIIAGFLYMIFLILLCLKTYSQSSIQQEICKHENLFKEIQFHPSYIYCITPDNSILFFHLDKIWSELTVFSKSDKFLFNILSYLNYHYSESSYKQSNDLLIYTFKQINNYEKSTSQNNH